MDISFLLDHLTLAASSNCLIAIYLQPFLALRHFDMNCIYDQCNFCAMILERFNGFLFCEKRNFLSKLTKLKCKAQN